MDKANLSEGCGIISNSCRSASGYFRNIHIACFTLCISCIAAFCGSCNPQDQGNLPASDFLLDSLQTDSSVVLPYVELKLSVKECSNIYDHVGGHLDHLDIFLYRHDIIYSLEKHLFVELDAGADLSDSVCVCVEVPDLAERLVAVVSNVSGTFDCRYLQRPEDLFPIQIPLGNDDVEYPVMTGLCNVEARESNASVIVSPLMSRIIVEEIENAFGGDTIVEYPSLQVINSPLATALFPDESPGQFTDALSIGPVALGPDIGRNGFSRPWVSTYLYTAADNPERTPRAVFSYMVCGEWMFQDIDLTSLKRNETVRLSLRAAPA